MSKEVWILSAKRTAIGSFLGNLSTLPAPKLGALCIESAVKASNIESKDVDEVIMGCVLSAGLGQAPARQASIFGALPKSVPATTVSKVCGSGLKAVMMGAQSILCGDSQCVVAGGMENMSLAPHLLRDVRTGHKFGHAKMLDSMIHDGLWDVYNDFHMGEAADMCATQKSISREDQDAYAKESYLRAQSAQTEGKFDSEIIPVEIKGRKGEVAEITKDEEVFKAKFEKFPNLRGAFSPEGSVTAANASTLNDGAAALVLADADWAKARGYSPLAVISGWTQTAREPEWFTLAPADALGKLCEKLNWKPSEVDLFEINEAFAVVALGVARELKLDMSKININGGAIALGHPIGASGARILVTLLHSLLATDQKKGMATLCIGGGEAVALGVERK